MKMTLPKTTLTGLLVNDMGAKYQESEDLIG